MDDYKSKTVKAFDKYYEIFDSKFDIYTKEFLNKEINLFLTKLSGKEILDLGSGSGNHSLEFKKRGFNPLCVDMSPKMVELCKERGLNAVRMDIENLNLEPKRFDGIWAYTSLLHFPKYKFNKLLDSLIPLIKKDGLIFIGMKEGSSEGFVDSKKYPGVQRWFSCYSDEELTQILSKKFNIIFKSRTQVEEVKGGKTFLNYLCKLKTA